MRLELTARRLDITPALRRVVQSKLTRLERLLNDAAVSAQVVLWTERASHHADVTLHARGEKFLHGAGTGGDFRAAMVSAVDKLVQQGTTVKGKWQQRKRRPARATTRSVPGRRARVDQD
jgi:putative sigma-54 modulation protein